MWWEIGVWGRGGVRTRGGGFSSSSYVWYRSLFFLLSIDPTVDGISVPLDMRLTWF